MRRSHDKIDALVISSDPTTGEVHRRHHVSESGMYRGRQVIVKSTAEAEAGEE
jgi:large subunit ribosomal protein L32